MAKDYILEMTLRVKNLNVCIKPDWTKKAVSQWHGILLNDGNDKYLLCRDICRWKMDAKIGPRAQHDFLVRLANHKKN